MSEKKPFSDFAVLIELMQFPEVLLREIALIQSEFLRDLFSLTEFLVRFCKFRYLSESFPNLENK